MNQIPIDFDAAEVRASEGILAAAEHADRVIPGWVDEALWALRRFLDESPDSRQPFTIERARGWISVNSSLPAPPDGRAWGQVTKRAAKFLIEPTGEFARAASSNNSPKMLYRKSVARA